MPKLDRQTLRTQPVPLADIFDDIYARLEAVESGKPLDDDYDTVAEVSETSDDDGGKKKGSDK